MAGGRESNRTFLLAGLGGLAVSLLILGTRNLYEDEWLSLAFMQRSLPELWRWTFDVGCHPPAALALDWLLLKALAPRAVAALHLVVWFGAVGYFILRARPLLASGWGRTWFAVLAFMHPQSLMWAGTLRWYAPWWALALTMVAAGLLPRREAGAPSWRATLGLGLAGAALLYMDYLAFIFLPCFGVAWLVRHRPLRPALARLLAMGAVAALAAWPVVTALPNREALTRCSVEVRDRLGAALHIGHGLSVSEAMMPWHPVAVLVALGVLAPCLWLFVRAVIGRSRTATPRPGATGRGLAALMALLLMMVAGAIVSGLGTKPRSFLGLATIAALPIAIGAEQIAGRRGRAWFGILAAAWIATGAFHLAARTGTAKRQLNDRPEEIIAQLEELSSHGPALVFTSSLVLTYEINERRARRTTPLVVCSTWNDRLHRYPPGLPQQAAGMPWVLVVEELESGSSPLARMMAEAMTGARSLIVAPRQLDVGRDPDAELKSRLSGRRMESRRFRVWVGRPAAGDWEAVGRRFTFAAGHSLLGDGL